MTSWYPDPSALRRPAYLSLADQIARAIADGRLGGGARLPTHRRLAEDLDLSVQTVSRAYEELIRRGLVAGEIGRGTFVRAPRREPDPPYIPERLGEVIDLSILKPVCAPLHLDRMRQALVHLAETLPPNTVLSFRPNAVLARHRVVGLEWLKACGIETAAGNVSLTNGATAAMTTALMTVTPPGSTLVTEEIGHHTLVPLAAYLGLKLKGLPIDEEGILPDALDRACRQGDVKALFIQPTVVNPTATLTGSARRADIVEIARRRDIAIIENDVLGPLVKDRPQPIAALAPERTLYVTSFTKIVLPGLRIGYLVVPDRLVSAVANRHLVTNWMATPLIAELATRWVENGTAMELVRWQRAALHRRHRIAAEMLRGIEHLTHPESLHIWLPLGEGRSEQAFVSHVRLQGVAIAPGASFATSPSVRHSAVRISVGSTTADDLCTGLGIVTNLLRSDPEPVLLAI
ncbi:PLP-dependent aminotransferase family protein [Rhodospirillaceae bacterium SYSU D60014]|uniref:MocR-like ectoine utilization transcription factor EhuR n=1 Tax=Virgifigura deserti TaxID=2268457 RepID=UPI000E67016A